MTQFTQAEKIANCKACTLGEGMKVCPLCQFYTVQKSQELKRQEQVNTFARFAAGYIANVKNATA